ncbi:MAG TPA: zinc-dependent peptidase, partial [Chitinophagales bacterium]
MLKVVVFFGVIYVAFRYRNTIREKIEIPNRSKVLPVPVFYKELLNKYFFYYQKLSPENKYKFEQKLCYFIAEKQFVPRGMPEVSQEMIVLISAIAVQITFGLPNVFLSHFKTILVYPSHYFSLITRQYHEGEVNPALGIIVLSWEDVAEG